MNETLLYKFLTDDMMSPLSSGRWRVNRWRSVRGELVPCANGLHAAGADNLAPFVDAQLWRVEIGDEYVWHTDTSMGRKIVARRMRIVERVEAWNAYTMRTWAADCAEHVLHHYERAYPNDTRPRDTLATVRRFLAGEASQEEVEAAAASAAWAAASAASAARAAAAAAWAAATWAAAAAAWAAATAWAAAAASWEAASWEARSWEARSAEQRWQSHRLTELLGLTWPTESEDQS